MFKVLRTFKIYPTGGSPVQAGTLSVPLEGLCVYGGVLALAPNRQQVYASIKAGELSGTNIFLQPMTEGELLEDLLLICDEAENFDFSSSVYQVNWNFRLAPQLIALVRGEMLSLSLTRLGISATGMLSKLSSVIGAIQVGMFKEAWQMLQYMVERDAFLTEERISRYVALLQSCDAIDYTIPPE